MKPTTAARKLEVYLPATPESFREGVVSREELVELQSNPPEWLVDLRKNGPHPKSVVAARLRISIGGLARAGVEQALTTAEIAALVEEQPEWLVEERATYQQVLRDERIRASKAADAAAEQA